MFNKLKAKIDQHPQTKSFILKLFVHPVKTRPRQWIRLFSFIYIKKGRHSVLYHNVRKDLVPFNRFYLGKRSVIESYSTLNNMVGDIIIGENSRIGLHNTIIGPVYIGNHTNLAQNITISGLNHQFQDPNQTIAAQGVSTAPIHIGDDVWIGANAVVTAGVKIGCHSVVGAGSVVTKSIPSYSVYAGNPAKLIKKYNFEKKIWVKA